MENRKFSHLPVYLTPPLRGILYHIGRGSRKQNDDPSRSSKMDEACIRLDIISALRHTDGWDGHTDGETDMVNQYLALCWACWWVSTGDERMKVLSRNAVRKLHVEIFKTTLANFISKKHLIRWTARHYTIHNSITKSINYEINNNNIIIIIK